MIGDGWAMTTFLPDTLPELSPSAAAHLLNSPILQPVITLVLWTLVMWIWLYATRIPAMMKAKIVEIEATDSAMTKVLVITCRLVDFVWPGTCRLLLLRLPESNATRVIATDRTPGIAFNSSWICCSVCNARSGV